MIQKKYIKDRFGVSPMDFKKITEEFQKYKGKKGNYQVSGAFDPKLTPENLKAGYKSFFCVTIHLKAPAMELGKNETGLPNPELTEKAFQNCGQIFETIHKVGKPIFFGYYFWFNEMNLLFYVNESDSNAIWNSLNPMLEEPKQGLNIVMSTRLDPEREELQFFQKSNHDY
ncbi:hypothetical protein P3G55_15315 [Leptospira sp. 96542]|nr:hypothetical protein [Leptospira sp. 96542]